MGRMNGGATGHRTRKQLCRKEAEQMELSRKGFPGQPGDGADGFRLQAVQKPEMVPR